MTDLTTQLAALVERYGAIASDSEALVAGNFDVLGGTIDDPASFNAAGGKTGALGYYPLTNANGQTVYFPCLARLLVIAGGPGGTAAVESILNQMIAARDAALAALASGTTKAGEAAASATAAAGSAGTAATKASETATSATAAAGSAGTAATKAGEASTSATAAAGSAGTAGTQAGIATTQAGIATDKATIAAAAAVATAADRVQTGADVVTTAGSAAAAASSAVVAAAATQLAGTADNDVIFKVSDNAGFAGLVFSTLSGLSFADISLTSRGLSTSLFTIDEDGSGGLYLRDSNGFYAMSVGSTGMAVAASSGVASNVVAGALTSTSFRVAADIGSDGAGLTKLVVATDAAFTNRTFISAVVTPRSTARDATLDWRSVNIAASGLRASTPYYYRLEVDGVAGATRTVTTAPAEGSQTAFRFVFASCNDPVLYSDFVSFYAMTALAPLFLLHLGDHGYYNFGTDDVRVQRNSYRAIRTVPAVAATTAAVPLVYMPDNHDNAKPNGYQETYTGTSYEQVSANSRQAYIECTPTYALGDATGRGLYHAFTIAQTKFIVLDTQAFRDATNMLGVAQNAWVRAELLAAQTAGVKRVFLCSGENWWTTAQGWRRTNTAAEQTALCDFIRDTALPAVTLLSGDIHYSAVDDGTNTDVATGGGLAMAQLCSSGAGVDPTTLSSEAWAWNGTANTYFDSQKFPFISVDVTATGEFVAKVWGGPYTGTTPTLLGTFSSTDAVPAVQFSQATMTAAAGSVAQAPLAKSFFGPVNGCSVAWSTSNGQSGSRTILSNNKKAAIPVTVPASGAITVTLSSPSGCALGAQSTLTLSAA